MLFAVQCRAQCVVIPHDAAKQSPECPLHKTKAPVESKCSHAPQWDLDDARQFVALLPDEPLEFTLATAPSLDIPSAPFIGQAPPVFLSLRL